MAELGKRASGSQVSWIEKGTSPDGNPELVRSSASRVPAGDETGPAIARQLNGPLTALLLYMGEIKQHSHQFGGDRDYLKKVVENALQQTERVCALVKRIAGADVGSDFLLAAVRAGDLGDSPRAPGAPSSPDARQKPLTKREREVLSLISEGFSNKEGALRMRISPRTFESHRAEAMRKLGARNTADLVRAALLHPANLV